MSATRKSCRPCRNPAPTTLAAGPDRTVSTGYSRATSARISVPSPLTIITGAVIDSRSSTRRSASSRCAICGVRRAFRAAVSARFGASSCELSSWLQVTGLGQMARIRSRARRSCAGLRTENIEATAKASTCAPCSRTAASMAASSSGCDSSPVPSWPPPTRTMTPPPPRLRCERSTIFSSKPMRRVQMELKRFSTTALVASVVDTDTSAMCSRRTPSGSFASTARIASSSPIDRSQGVVRDFALATTRRCRPGPPHRCRCPRYPPRY